MEPARVRRAPRRWSPVRCCPAGPRRSSFLGLAAGRRGGGTQLVATAAPAAIELVDGDGGDPPPLRGPEARSSPRCSATTRVAARRAARADRRVLRATRRRRRADRASAQPPGAGGARPPPSRSATWARARGAGAARRARRPARDVRTAAARSLGRLGAVEAIEPLLAAGVERRSRATSPAPRCSRSGPRVPACWSCSRDADADVRAPRSSSSACSAAPATPAACSTHAPRSRRRRAGAAAGALGRLGAPRGADALIARSTTGFRWCAPRPPRALGRSAIGGRSMRCSRVARTDAFEPAAAAAQALGAIDPALVIRAAVEPDAGAHLHEAADRRRCERAARPPARRTRSSRSSTSRSSTCSTCLLTVLAWREMRLDVRGRRYSALDEVFASPLTPGSRCSSRPSTRRR